MSNGRKQGETSKVNNKSNLILYKKMQAEVNELLPPDNQEGIN